MPGYAGDAAIWRRSRRALVTLGAVCATGALAGALAEAAGGPAWLDAAARGLGGLSLLLAGGSLLLRARRG